MFVHKYPSRGNFRHQTCIQYTDEKRGANRRMGGRLRIDVPRTDKHDQRKAHAMNAWYRIITSVIIVGVAAALTAGCTSQTALTGNESLGQSPIPEAGGTHVPGWTESLASGDPLGAQLFDAQQHDVVNASIPGSAKLTRLEEPSH